MAQITKQQLEDENNSFREKNEELLEKNKKLSSDFDNLQESLEQLEDDNIKSKEANQEKDDMISQINSEKEVLQEKIDEAEVKRLASAFEESAEEYSKERDFAFDKLTDFASLVLVFVVGFFIVSFIFLDLEWIDRFNLLPVFGISIFILNFYAKQHSLYRGLYVDMKYRQTLAQSYYNVLRSIQEKDGDDAENENIKPMLSEEVIKRITAPPQVNIEKIEWYSSPKEK